MNTERTWAQVVGTSSKPVSLHVCDDCAHSFLCVGELLAVSGLCHCPNQEISSTGLIYWCSRYCMNITTSELLDEKASDEAYDDCN
jgi:hypothetical protein